ncbi:uncharacterized protein M421DRAFT_422584 [Didymella exigua CBS 183.55]|uniref:Uncharacterized protein n=1 Tax=Didymella exigua CBS 183.55 TaxID=1150837 RepID=A0A6A5RHN8_9PLEO|nr:uncharacterized protein M421DRAFT_422584 [Didymella exigua CBS 183.55]KAF1926614.1 hypothetical protein M421DRAFT_422584 [Didymella exigua CBS 183.55]
MASNFSNDYTPAGKDTDIMKLPEQVDGLIDVEILIDIHKCLSESKYDDDRALGVWVQTNYLQEPLDLLEERARLIRNAEGFVKLDKAYRRARQLTGKAQDKWPFLNTDGKKLSSTLIKNVILGDTAMGIARTESSGGARDTPMSNGLDGHHDKYLHTPNSRASLSANNLSGHQAQKLKSPQFADRPVNQQATEQKANRQDHSPASKSSSMADTANGTPSSAEALQDAGSGKVRGPHGRYVNKENPIPPTKNKSNIKNVKKSRTRATLEGESDEEVEEHKKFSRLSSSENEEGASEDNSEPPVSAQIAAATPLSFPASAILAAEADAIPSSLDRMPPGVIHKKRKSESSLPRGGLKRARGSRGGVLGRPRKSETLADRAKLEVDEAKTMEVHDPTPQSTPQPDTPANITTRRSSRKSAVSALESSTPWDPANDVLFGGSSQKQTTRSSTIAPANGTDRAFDLAKAVTPSSSEQKPKSAAKKVVFSAAPTTPAKSSTFQAIAQNASISSQQKMRVSYSSETQGRSSNVEYFARITTMAGIQEVPLLKEDLTHGVDLIEAYARWQMEGNAPVSFEVFKNIVLYTRPS